LAVMRARNEVIENYQEMLLKYPVAILDVSMLPVPKAKMKVLLKGMYAKQTKPEFQKYFEQAYMFLSQFQEGVGPKPISGVKRRD
jgi:hypothetical protein